MPNLDAIADFLEQRFTDRIRAHEILPAEAGAFAPFPASLNPLLKSVLKDGGITELYAHQAAAFEHLSASEDTVLVSRTASGKTLSFLLPILNEYLSDENGFTVLLLYPTKALSRDQEGTLSHLMHAATGDRRLGTFDGDTPREERRNIQRNADFVITNPDMLHAGILPNHHRNWKSFMRRLRYVVVDEVHTYRGAFGSHVANVFRRLERICEIHGSRPTFVCSSATVGNPGEHVQALFGRPFHVIDQDGAPRPRRDLYFMNPSMVTGSSGGTFRKGTSSITIPLIRKAAEAGVRTICFCRARQQVERLYRAVTDKHPSLKHTVKPYRGGLLPNERRALERDLFEGRITTIITTNALELGIDIGDLDLCLLSGHPGTVASFWQQAGRVGRKGDRAMVVFSANDSPIDQYLVHHPDFITSTPIEQAWLNANNPYILLQHLPCAAHEHPLRAHEPLLAGPAFEAAQKALLSDGTLKPYRDCLRYGLEDYPAKGVNLRGLTDYNVTIYNGSEVIGEIDPIGARGTLYKDAIYQHLGRRYMSMELDLDKKLCRVDPVTVNYYTEAVWENRIELTDVESESDQRGAQISFGLLNVNKQPKLYKKIRERSFENIGYGPITLPPFEYETMGFSLQVPRPWLELVDALDLRYLGAAFYGLSYVLHRAAPGLCMADPGDIETDTALQDATAERWQSALYLYDKLEGGAGYAEKLVELLPEALSLCQTIIDECDCSGGCPACIPPLPPGVEQEELAELLTESDAALQCTHSLLAALLTGELTAPEVHEHTQPRSQPPTPPAEDKDAIRLARNMDRAAGILRRKREREH